MKNIALPCGILSLILLALPIAKAAVIQTNFGTGDGTTPGGAFSSAGNLLSSNLSSATFLSGGSFYRQDSGYPVVLSRLYDGALGSLGSTGLGNDGNFTVMPNIATLQFDLNGAFNLTTIRTYASWDDGRDGQQYVVKYATATAPGAFTTLHSVTAYDNTSFPTTPSYDFSSNQFIQVPDMGTSSTLVTLTENTTGVLAENVVSLQFVFDVYYQDGRGYENGGTAFREFQVLGTSVSSVPEPGTFLPAALLVAGAWLRRRRPRSRRSSGAAA